MSIAQGKPTAFLGFGLQSGGSTFLSYCFLQRPEMSGILDWYHDRLPDMPSPALTGSWWCKCTVASFRAEEVIDYVADHGWNTRPLLIARDVRQAMDSLVTRDYGRNSTTGEDPPLRTRVRRYLADWEYFRDIGLPIVRFEDFTAEPEVQLRRACEDMGLAWTDDMIAWPKPRDTVWKGGGANQTFIDSLGVDLHATLRLDDGLQPLRHLPSGELDWLDETCAEYNRALGYPETAAALGVGAGDDGWLPPKIENASRYPGMQVRRVLGRVLPALRRLRRRRAVGMRWK